MRSYATVTILMMVVFGSGLAHAQRLQFTPNDVLRSEDLNSLVNAVTGANVNPASIIPVDCDAGQRIGEALLQALPGSTIQVTGTCNETVTITTDRITLDGQGTTIIDGGGANVPVIAVRGAQEVRLTGLTVQNGRHGILGSNGAALRLHNITAQQNTAGSTDGGGLGIGITGSSTAVFTGSIISVNNVNDGLNIGSGSNGNFDETLLVRVNNNGDRGLQVSGSSNAQLVNVQLVEALNNATDGIRVAENGSMLAITFGETPFEIHTNGNSSDGIEAATGSSMSLLGMMLSAMSNNRGLIITDGSVMRLLGNFTSLPGPRSTPQGSALFENNTNDGIVIVRGGVLENSAGMPLIVRNNGDDGISVSNGGNLTLNDATINNNNNRGIFLFNSGVANLTNVQISNHANAFAALSLNSQASVKGNTLTVTNNGGRGISLDNHCSLNLDNSMLMGNGDSGIALFNGSAAILNNVQIANHADAFAALQIEDNSSVVNFSSPPEVGVTVSDNGGIGVFVDSGSVFRAGSSMITNNAGHGIRVDGGQIQISNTTLTGNGGGADLNASFGARLQFDGGNSIGAITCDDTTVLSRGDAGCP